MGQAKVGNFLKENMITALSFALIFIIEYGGTKRPSPETSDNECRKPQKLLKHIVFPLSENILYSVNIFI